MSFIVTNRQLQQQLIRIETKVDLIMAAQDDIAVADTAIEAEVADLAAQDKAIQAAQAQLLATIQALQTQGVDTSQLVADTAALLQAQGANDSVVAALTAAANPPAPSEA